MQLYQMSLLEIVQGAGNCFARGRDALADLFVRKWQPEPSLVLALRSIEKRSTYGIVIEGSVVQNHV